MKRTKRFFVPILAAVAVLSVFTACGKDKKAAGALRTADSDGLFAVRIIEPTVFNEFSAADLLGYFKEEGIKVEYVGTVQGVSNYQLLEQDALDVATGHPPQVAQARLAGMKIVAVIPGMVDHPQYPHVRYFVRENGPIKSLDDIVGKKAAIGSFSACSDGYLRYYLNERGIKGDVEFVVLPTGGQPEQALTQGLIDMTNSHPPFGSIAKKAGGNVQIASSWDILHSPGAGLSIRAFTEDFVTKYPEVVRGFSRAMYRARLWINANMEEAVPLVSAHVGLDPDNVDIEWDAFWFEDSNIIRPEYIDKWFEIAESLEYWKHGDIKPEDIYTNEFAPAPVVSSAN
ncbi:ABC transporter substrate-binding protein [Treponema primitia]|uniref:ABC transporter substrate-binding protein n=1 Tax=Treponema primitia TaxID=88058 RepID=UPI00025554C9|nr:ABC transporter substrate-binding protein [Treponema primitia]